MDLVTRVLTHHTQVFGHDWPRAGLPDGGACRPRDLRAMAAADPSVQLSLYYQGLADDALHHYSWLATKIANLSWGLDRAPVVMLGDAYRRGVPYTDGSPPQMLQWYLRNHFNLAVSVYDPLTEAGWPPPPDQGDAVYVLAVPHRPIHEWLTNTPVPISAGSIIVDPTGWLSPKADGTFRGHPLIQPGRRS